MRSVQILTQIVHTILQNPSISPTLPWDDIRLCILAELDDRQILYTDEQYHSVKTSLQSKVSEIEFAVIHADYTSAINHLSEIIFALKMLPNNDFSWENYYRKNFSTSCLTHYQQNTVIVLGDSHVNFFSGNELLSFLPIGNDINTCKPTNLSHIFTPLHLGPCLAYHCNHYGSSFRFREKAEFLCQNFIKPTATIICSLGEIDLRVHVFRQTILQNKSYEEIIDDILQEYYTFLLKMKNQGYSLYCWSPIATQIDACPIDPNFPRNGSEEERNHATAYFNQQLYSFCKQHNIGYLSIFDQMITPDFKTRSEYLSADCCHLSQRALPLALQEWKKINHPTLPDNLL